MTTKARSVIEQTASGLGYVLLDVAHLARGLLRITIDWPWDPQVPARVITVDDCEKLTRQLSYVLEVEGIDYERLEVSSPGANRPLTSEADLERFLGARVELVLKAPVGQAASDTAVSPLRRRFLGRLEKSEGNEPGWQIVWQDELTSKPGQKISPKRRAALPWHVLGFSWNEVREARLAPEFNFKPKSSF